MAKRADVVDEVITLMRKARAPAKWHERIAPEHVDTIAQLKAAWRDGKLGTSKKAAAVGISQYLNSNGISNVGHNGVITWLDEA